MKQIISFIPPMGKYTSFLWVATGLIGVALFVFAPDLRSLLLIMFALIAGIAAIATFLFLIELSETLRAITDALDDLFERMQHAIASPIAEAMVATPTTEQSRSLSAQAPNARDEPYDPSTGVSIPFSDIFKEL